MESGLGLKELKSCLIDIALTHPTISVSKVKVPAPLMTMQQHMINYIHRNHVAERDRKLKHKYFLEWPEYESLCISNSILLRKHP